MKITLLPTRGVLKISGADSAQLLQGATTQKIPTASELQQAPQTPSLLYAAHLSPQGKFLFDFFALPQPDGSFLLDCAQTELMALATALHRYAVGLAVEFEDLSADYEIYALWAATKPQAAAPPPLSAAGLAALPDPRTPAMGWRLITPKQGKKEGELQNATCEEYEQHRLSCGIPDGSVDAQKNKTLPAELGLEFLNGVSFTKGCYVGQEVTARMHHRTQPKKRLYRVHFGAKTSSEFTQKAHKSANFPVGTPLLAGTVEAGTLFSNNGQVGLALIRERYISAPLTAEGAPCTPSLPDYWHSSPQ